MYEHIAYELRYEHFKFNKAWLNMHESTKYLTTLIELFVHIDCEKQFYFRVLIPRETTNDKLANMLVSKSQTIE